MKWIGNDKQETWEPQCNVPKAMVDAYEKGDPEPAVNSQQITEQFGVTVVTEIKVKASNERSLKKMKMNGSSPNERYEILMKVKWLVKFNVMVLQPKFCKKF